LGCWPSNRVNNPLADETGREPELSASPVTVGTRVEVELIDRQGSTERLAFDLVPNSKADFAAGFLGAGTPLAQAILGQRAGDVLPYQFADILEVRILSVEISQRAPASESRASREMVIRDAVSRSNLDDAVRLALTVDVKWGDYDPEGIASHWEE
jgi:hypothetical protein